MRFPRAGLPALIIASLLLPAALSASVELARSEQGRVAAIIQHATGSQQPGVAGLLFGRKPAELSRRQVMQLAVGQSPAVLANEQSRTIAEASLQRQNAEFDWVLGLTTSISQTSFNERTEQITRERVTTVTVSGDDLGDTVEDAQDGPQVGEDGEPVAVTDSVGNLLCITVAGEIANPEQCALQTEISTNDEFASVDADSTNAWTFGASTSRVFGVGSQLQFGLGVSRRTKNFYPLDDAGLIAPLSNSDPIGNGSRYPWTSRLFAEYLTPLPFSKGYGRYGSAAALGVELAKINNQQSIFTEQAVRQSLLLQIDQAYWGHVRSMLRLQSAVAIRENLEARLASAERRFRQRALTNYELAQVQSALASARAREQSAWVGFVASSDQLVNLLAMDAGTVVLPAGFYDELGDIGLLDRNTLLKSVLDDNPGVNASRVAVRNSEVLMQSAERNLKPDLNVVLSLELSQSDRVLGYENMGDSLSNLFSPDNTNWFIGVQYKLPFGKNAEKARRRQASIRLTRSRDTVLLDEVDLTSQVNALAARNNASMTLVNNAEQRLRLAQTAFDRANTARDQGSISEFEYLSIVSDLDSARLAWIDQLVDQQQIESSAQALQGKLGGQQGGAGQ
ncbi:MAG: TolC family protein [Gammaproteobacteria bacterium]|nr:TolC family protein [Gammaproteobacteria bacterium]